MARFSEINLFKLYHSRMLLTHPTYSLNVHEVTRRAPLYPVYGEELDIINLYTGLKTEETSNI